MAPVDAQFYWMSAKVPNDQFLLYAFAGVPGGLEDAIGEVVDRARACPDLTMCIDDSRALRYPRWRPADQRAGVVRHQLADDSWTGCLDAVAGLTDDPLDARRSPWRLHVFAPVRELPGMTAPGSVAVLQAVHALADGTRASALAAWLFGRPEPVPQVVPPPRGHLAWRTVQASRAHRRMLRDTAAGLLVPAGESRPALITNSPPAGARSLRTLVRRRDQLPGPTVTVAVLAAVSSALSAHLGAEALGAEVLMAKPGMRLARNHFRSVSVGLYPADSERRRADLIAADLANARRRGEHPAMRAADLAFAATPAPLLRWGVSRFDPTVRPQRVGGNTVVSSVYRGAADLRFGGVPVLLTAGYPALSPAMGLTHGVHGIGDTVAISVHAAESAIGDVDGYLDLLDAAL